MVKRIMLIFVFSAVGLAVTGCGPAVKSHGDSSPISGRVGVRIQSEDTSRFVPGRAPY